MVVAIRRHILIPYNLKIQESNPMNATATKKKLMLAAILTSGLTLAISQAAWAETAQAVPSGKQGDTSYQPRINPEMRKAHEKFLDDTVAIRKEMVEKGAVMRALMNAAAPDTAKVAQVAGELFELREKLRTKAQEAGLPMPMLGQGYGMGCGLGYGMGHGGRGMGPGKGMGKNSQW
jgi:zinc resistance-associated protein